METVFYDKRDSIVYSYMNGVTPCRVNMFTPFIRSCSHLFFDILEQENIQYAVFAGSAIGLYRNALNIPWVDDFDIIILENQIPKIKQLVSVLNHYGFYWRYRRREKGGGIQVYYYPDHTRNILYGGTFQCDIFFSYFDRDKHLKNKGGWGLYHERKVKQQWVLPFKKHLFEGKHLPFFNNYLEDIKHEYGDIDQAVIHIQHKKYHLHLKKHWRLCYREFNVFVRQAKNNTRKAIGVKSHPKAHTTVFLVKNFENFFHVDFLRRVNYLAPRELVIVDLRFLKYILDLRTFLPKIKITALLEDIPSCWLLHLSLVNEILTENTGLANFLLERYPLIDFKHIKLISAIEKIHLNQLPQMDVTRMRLTPEPPQKVPDEPAPAPPKAKSPVSVSASVKSKSVSASVKSKSVKRSPPKKTPVVKSTRIVSVPSKMIIKKTLRSKPRPKPVITTGNNLLHNPYTFSSTRAQAQRLSMLPYSVRNVRHGGQVPLDRQASSDRLMHLYKQLSYAKSHR
jgi:hypothetical protein